MDSRHLELRTLQRLKEEPGSGGRYLLAVSGGVDSMVMLEVLSRLQSALHWDWSVVHVHHGASPDSGQKKFRDEAQAMVRKVAEAKNMDFITNPIGQASEFAANSRGAAKVEECETQVEGSENQAEKSEQAHRKFRYLCFEKWLVEKSATGVMLAHQSQDWLESQLIMMIRGSSASLVRAPNFSRLRPLSDWSKEEILFYANENKLSWVEDPSNSETTNLRNWLRHEWLPQLEQHRPGAGTTLARSMELLWGLSSAENKILQNPNLWLSAVEVSRLEFTALSVLDQRRVIAAMMNNNGVRDYSQAQIKEVLKRLDTDQKVHSFRVAKSLWSLSPVAFKIHVDSRPDGSSAV